ncbi:MAG: class I SAM-dependent methyltransferase family protein [Candidatus Nezhaarchaeales archaeon]|nr:MAG: tRNA (guanine-N1)-methyltransferase [Candidatus Nezhaarchaeota archaeon WYZ-LMO8]TDA34485.1 MAG: tRNA (guanine-N1)-methyltransferase [Candidatus Nezhaarchaeota archaeon WYZ-LMO7]
MVAKTLAVLVAREKGEAVRRYLASINALSYKLKIKVLNSKLAIPLSRQLLKTEEEDLNKICEVEVREEDFEERPSKPKSILEWLSDKMPPHLLASAPRSWDLIGDIAIIDVPDELLGYEKLVAEAILAVHKNVKSVYAKASPISGDFRIRDLRLLGGEDKSITFHKEYGAIFYVDVKNVYFSPRLATERKRVAELVRDGEVVLDMFSGAGPFAIQIAMRRSVLVHAIELNPIAYECLKKNIELNKVQGKVIPHLGDAREVIEKELIRKVDRVIMNLPGRSLEFIDAALKALRDRGVLHVYAFVEEPKPIEKAEEKVVSEVKARGWTISGSPFTRLVRQVAPRRWQIAIDLEVQRSL